MLREANCARVSVLMKQIGVKPSCSRLLVLLWASLWMLIVPLVHVHPEADHAHGGERHVHGGTIHTVFSQDLECEYEDAAHDSTCPDATHQHLQSLVHPGHGLNHPEIEFSLLTVPVDRPLPKPGVMVSGLPIVENPMAQPALVLDSFQPDSSHTVLFLSTALPLRAPPFLSI